MPNPDGSKTQEEIRAEVRKRLNGGADGGILSDITSPASAAAGQAGQAGNDITGRTQGNAAADAQRARGGIAQLVAESAGQDPTREQLAGGPYSMERALTLDPSARATAQADPRGEAAQRMALDRMQREASRMGLSDADRMAVAAGNERVTQGMRGGREQMQAGLRAQGTAGSGAELRGLFGGDQAAQAMTGNGANIAQAAQQRALQALAGTGTVSGQMRGQSFDERFKRGSAIDDRTQWNYGNAQDVGTRNVDSQNRQIDNNARSYADQFGMQLRRADIATNQHDRQAAAAAARAREKAQRTSNYVAGGASLAKSFLDDDEDDDG